MPVTLISPTNVLVKLTDESYRQVDITTAPVAFLPVLLKVICDHFDAQGTYGGGLDFQVKQLRSLNHLGFDDQREFDKLLREHLLIVCETWFKLGRNTLLPTHMQEQKKTLCKKNMNVHFVSINSCHSPLTNNRLSKRI